MTMKIGVWPDSHMAYLREYRMPGTMAPMWSSRAPGNTVTRAVSRLKQPCRVFTLLSFSCLCNAFTMPGTWECSKAKGLRGGGWKGATSLWYMYTTIAISHLRNEKLKICLKRFGLSSVLPWSQLTCQSLPWLHPHRPAAVASGRKAWSVWAVLGTRWKCQLSHFLPVLKRKIQFLSLF